MKTAYIFPGQGAQFVGMGADLFAANRDAQMLFEEADRILGFALSEVMFRGTEDELKQTSVTQPAIFVHSVLVAKMLGDGFQPDFVAGHSLGEYSALVSAKALSFQDGLKLVSQRANAMQKACDLKPSTMAAILGMEDRAVEEICQTVQDQGYGVVVPANYNSPGQLVISGDVAAVEAACALAKEKGAKRALVLPVNGAFHSPLMEPARVELAAAIEATRFESPICPVVQNVNAKGELEAGIIKANLVAQLTAPVRWSHSVEEMGRLDVTNFVECGPGNVLQGLVKKILKEAVTSSAKPLGEVIG